MNWPVIFLGCFVFGFLLSALSFALGAVHAHFHIHVPWGHHVHGNVFHGGNAHVVGPINFATVTAFLAWLSGTGFLLTTESRWLAVPAVLLAVVVGLIGATIVFWIMAHVLWSPDENMQSVDYHMVGVLGRLTQPIRGGNGVGELVYAQGGTRKSCGARSADGQGIEKGAEVIVTGYDRGIASVRRYSDLAERL